MYDTIIKVTEYKSNKMLRFQRRDSKLKESYSKNHKHRINAVQFNFSPHYFRVHAWGFSTKGLHQKMCHQFCTAGCADCTMRVCRYYDSACIPLVSSTDWLTASCYRQLAFKKVPPYMRLWLGDWLTWLVSFNSTSSHRKNNCQPLSSNLDQV